MDRLKQRMEKRGFRATATYNEFHGWFQKATGIQPKAMDMFNQTVAVVFLAFISYLALKEYLSLIPTRRIDRATNRKNSLSGDSTKLVLSSPSASR